MVGWFEGADGVGEGDALAMTRLVSRGISKEKAKQAIDLLLEDKSDEFRATVFELCRQIGWPDDEPSFLFAIMTNQLHALVKQYPERISEAMVQAARELEQDWQRIQGQLAAAAVQQSQTLDEMSQRLLEAELTMQEQLSETRQLLAEERSAMVAVMAQERDHMRQLLADERTAMTRQAQELAEQQKQVLKAQTTNLIAQGVLSWREQADKHVKQLIKTVRTKHRWQWLSFAAIALAIVISTAWIGGWVSNSRAQAASPWGDIERWNQNQLQACLDVNSTTCNFHIQVPKE